MSDMKAVRVEWVIKRTACCEVRDVLEYKTHETRFTAKDKTHV